MLFYTAAPAALLILATADLAKAALAHEEAKQTGDPTAIELTRQTYEEAVFQEGFAAAALATATKLGHTECRYLLRVPGV